MQILWLESGQGRTLQHFHSFYDNGQALPVQAGRLKRSPAMIVLLLALLLGLQPITTDLYLPALPTLTQGFGASMVQAQLTLTALLLAFGTSQLFWGPLSDKWGRRPVLLGGIAVYVEIGRAHV